MRLLIGAVLGLAAATACADEAWITNQNGDDVSVLDLSTRKVAATIKVGGKPACIAMAHDGRFAWVSSTNGKYISKIDCATRKVVGRLNLPDEAVGIAIGKGDRFLYAVGFFKGQIFKVDATTMTMAATADVGGTPSGIAATPDGGMLVVTQTRLTRPDGGDRCRHAEDRRPGRGRPQAVRHHRRCRRQARLHGTTSTATTSRWSISRSRTLVGRVSTGKRPYVVALAGGKGFVTDQYEGKVQVFDLATLKPEIRIATGDYPDGIEASFDGRSVWVVNWESDSVSQIDVGSLKVVATTEVGDSPRSFGTFLRKTP